MIGRILSSLIGALLIMVVLMFVGWQDAKAEGTADDDLKGRFWHPEGMPATKGDPTVYARLCAEPGYQDNADLCQQWRAAQAAEEMARWAFPQLIISAVGAILVLATVVYTHLTLRSTSDNSKIQLRAYLAVDVGGASYQERDKNIRFEARPVLTNTGSTPARNINYKLKVGILPVPIPEYFSPELEDIPFSAGGSLGQGNHRTMSARIMDFINDSDVNDVMIGNKNALYVWGIVTYEDVFSEKHFTRFCQQIEFRRLPPPDESKVNVSGYFIGKHEESS